MKIQKSFEERTIEKFDELKKIEDEKRMLHDTSIGGDMVYRPNEKERWNITGPILSDEEVLEKAEGYVRRDMDQERIAERNQETNERRNRDLKKDKPNEHERD